MDVRCCCCDGAGEEEEEGGVEPVEGEVEAIDVQSGQGRLLVGGDQWWQQRVDE